MSLRTSDYDYELPDDLIACRPADRRDESRMMVIHRESGQIAHRNFRDLTEYLLPGDLAVFNNTKVIPARLFDRARNVEILLLEPSSGLRWRAMVKPGKKMRLGHQGEFGGARATVVSIEPDGTRVLEFDNQPDLARYGAMPLPPYIARPSDAQDLERYQTVYAEYEGAVAAPTAGLHFTKPMLESIPHTMVTLHVGAGTFKPVQADDLSGHRMHTERFQITAESARQINAASRILAVGTTVVRVLESVADAQGKLHEKSGETDIFIHPPYAFKAVDLLLTNFHLPKSTLLMLVSALAGRELILEAYRQAAEHRYRFFSYGDCMLVVP